MSDVYAEQPWLKSYDRNVPPELKYEDRTFAEQFRVVADRYPDKTALHYMGKSITYREIDLLSNRLAPYFQKIGLKPDDVVGLHLPNLRPISSPSSPCRRRAASPRA
jgi:long-chain acyl-CoA synthetase